MDNQRFGAVGGTGASSDTGGSTGGSAPPVSRNSNSSGGGGGGNSNTNNNSSRTTSSGNNSNNNNNGSNDRGFAAGAGGAGGGLSARFVSGGGGPQRPPLSSGLAGLRPGGQGGVSDHPDAGGGGRGAGGERQPPLLSGGPGQRQGAGAPGGGPPFGGSTVGAAPVGGGGGMMASYLVGGGAGPRYDNRDEPPRAPGPSLLPPSAAAPGTAPNVNRNRYVIPSPAETANGAAGGPSPAPPPRGLSSDHHTHTDDMPPASSIVGRGKPPSLPNEPNSTSSRLMSAPGPRPPSFAATTAALGPGPKQPGVAGAGPPPHLRGTGDNLPPRSGPGDSRGAGPPIDRPKPGGPPAPAAGGPPPPPGGPGGMRELRVEDALLYLDHVKMEFKDRPQVYNEFLAIMKNFKTQAVDTPGVIKRVSKLFRGYNNLILGFNTFLPDDYKIRLCDLERQEAEERAFEEAQAAAAAANREAQAAAATAAAAAAAVQARAIPPPLPSQQISSQRQQQQQQQPPPQQSQMSQGRPPSLSPSAVASSAAAAARGGPPPHRWKGSPPPPPPSASYETVAQQHHPSPTQPLPKMGGGGGPLETVRSKNASPLPSSTLSSFEQQQQQQQAKKQQLPAPPPQQQQQQSHHVAATTTGVGAIPTIQRQMSHSPPPVQPPATTAVGRPPAAPAAGASKQPAESRRSRSAASSPPAAAQPAAAPPPPPQQQPSAVQQQQHQAVEFDHAISYVTTIKRRFANDPSTYHQFLEILHTYQKEQRGIKEVLEQVAHLFQDHPDLLKEFTFFLPDAVQDQAKERLHRAAAESESRQQAARQRQLEQQQQQQQQQERSYHHHHHHEEQQQQRRGGGRMAAAQVPSSPAPVVAVSSPAVAFPAAVVASAAAASPTAQNVPSSATKAGAPAASQQGNQHFMDMTAGRAAAAGQAFPIGATAVAFGPVALAPSAGDKRTADGVAVIATHQQQQQQQPTVYNSAVERQFFDAAKEALTAYSRDGGQAWAEFLKCLDMYAQDILSRNEMLNFVEPLLGKRNTKLFEEFKRILAAAGSPTDPLPLMEDSWYSVPLSEIDFSRCRRCTPSYRALPRDYPAPPCGDRNEVEAKVLNDVWVSLPVGSEESYTFRHMRRNTYEEALFRVEDERFEIDMVIDSNAATLHRLEPIAAEIAQLAKEDLAPAADFLVKQPPPDGSGLGGRRFQYTFDKTILGVIQRNTIARIYGGDAGQEMLDWMVKNPTVAIPIVVDRLRQKDREWRTVRKRLNKQWKELAQQNYYKSLDHRSLTWRTTDKRATSTRTLTSEIKDRATNNGKEGQEAQRQKMDKAKEEHGTFYEITMGELMSKDLDLTYLPKPDRRLFTPHLSFLYENNSWAQRDAYRILSFALERGHITPADKERCHRLWIEFLGPLFNLSLNWMMGPAVAYQESTAAITTNNTAASPPAAAAALATNPTGVVSEDDEEDSMDEEHVVNGNILTEEMGPIGGSKGGEPLFTDHHPLPAGAFVSTLYGDGKIVDFRKSDHMYVIKLNFGAKCYMRPSSVLCSILPVEKSAYTRQLRKHDVSKLARSADQLVIGTQSFYLFMRLHQILIRRLNIAKKLSFSVGDDRTLKTLVEQMPNSNPSAVGRRRYEAYLSLVYALLDGGVGGAAEGGKFEDRVRMLLGHGSYELATMDKLISHIWKNIQAMAGDETMWNLVQLYRRHMDAGSLQPEAFRQEAAYHSEGEPMYGFQYCPVVGKDAAVVHMEYLGVMEDEDDEAADDDDEEGDDVDMTEEEVETQAQQQLSTKRQRL